MVLPAKDVFLPPVPIEGLAMKYRKKPLVIEAVRWTGRTMDQVAEFIGFPPSYDRGGGIKLRTLEGIMRAATGDWIIKGIKDELYPCKDDIFTETYEPAE